ncbi:MAG: ketoacyl-ACP synthase III [Burkholderiales bacterium]|nr:ketoacyl-ACP synthase III [Bacteroidia bacterium]
MSFNIDHISIYLPETTVNNDVLALEFDITQEQIFKNTHINRRFISNKNELSSDMAIKAGNKLFEETKIEKDKIDFLIFCSEGFDYIAPASSCIIQYKLGLSTSIGCFDLPYGCSGYVYGLGIAYGLLKAGIAKTILFLTADIPSKGIAKNDLELRSIFSDIATASLITLNDFKPDTKFIYGTDGKGALDLYVEGSGFRAPVNPDFKIDKDLVCGQMLMNGTNIFLFAVKKVPILVNEILEKNKLAKEDIDLYVFHQASYFMIEVIRKKLKLPPEKVFINIQDYGNSVSSTIPLALYDAAKKGILKKGMRIVLAGFGIGNSWGATIIEY